MKSRKRGKWELESEKVNYYNFIEPVVIIIRKIH